MSVLKQPLVPQRQRATPRRLTTEPTKGGKELAKSKAAFNRVMTEIDSLRWRKKPANGTPAAQLDALIQSYYAKAGRLISLIAPDMFKSDDLSEFHNMDAINRSFLEVQEESLKVLRGEVSFGEAAKTTALASLASSRGASLPDLVKEFEHHLSIVFEDRRERARYHEQTWDKGRMGVDDTGKRRHFSGEEVQAMSERRKKYRADVASGERTVPKYDDEENVESLIKGLESQRARSDATRGLHAARIEASHDMSIELPTGIRRATEGRYAIHEVIAVEAGASFDNTPSTDLAAVVARLKQARALSGVKERAPRTLPAGVACKDGKFWTFFQHAKGQVSLSAFGSLIYFETAEEAAAAIARFRAASAEEQKAMISKQLKCCKCGQPFRGRSRNAVKERLKAHEKTCTPASTL